MWNLWRMSQSLGRTPSELLRIANSAKAFFFDRAVWLFGSTLEAEMEAVTKNVTKAKVAEAKQQAVLAKWLAPSGVKGLYRDPARR